MEQSHPASVSGVATVEGDVLADRDEREDEALPEDLESLPSEFALSEVEGDYPAQEDAGIVPDEEVSPLQLEDPDPWEDTEGIAKLSDEAFDQSIATALLLRREPSPTVCGSHEGPEAVPTYFQHCKK